MSAPFVKWFRSSFLDRALRPQEQVPVRFFERDLGMAIYGDRDVAFLLSVGAVTAAELKSWEGLKFVSVSFKHFRAILSHLLGASAMVEVWVPNPSHHHHAASSSSSPPYLLAQFGSPGHLLEVQRFLLLADASAASSSAAVENAAAEDESLSLGESGAGDSSMEAIGALIDDTASVAAIGFASSSSASSSSSSSSSFATIDNAAANATLGVAVVCSALGQVTICEDVVVSLAESSEDYQDDDDDGVGSCSEEADDEADKKVASVPPSVQLLKALADRLQRLHAVELILPVPGPMPTTSSASSSSSSFFSPFVALILKAAELDASLSMLSSNLNDERFTLALDPGSGSLLSRLAPSLRLIHLMPPPPSSSEPDAFGEPADSASDSSSSSSSSSTRANNGLLELSGSTAIRSSLARHPCAASALGLVADAYCGIGDLVLASTRAKPLAAHDDGEKKPDDGVAADAEDNDDDDVVEVLDDDDHDEHNDGGKELGKLAALQGRSTSSSSSSSASADTAVVAPLRFFLMPSLSPSSSTSSAGEGAGGSSSSGGPLPSFSFGSSTLFSLLVFPPPQKGSGGTGQQRGGLQSSGGAGSIIANNSSKSSSVTPAALSLFHYLNRFVATKAGSRLLRSWLLAPLTDAAEIRRRQGIVEALLDQGSTEAALRPQLRRFLREATRGAFSSSLLLPPSASSTSFSSSSGAGATKKGAVLSADFEQLGFKMARKRAASEAPQKGSKGGGGGSRRAGAAGASVSLREIFCVYRASVVLQSAADVLAGAMSLSSSLSIGGAAMSRKSNKKKEEDAAVMLVDENEDDEAEANDELAASQLGRSPSSPLHALRASLLELYSSLAPLRALCEDTFDLEVLRRSNGQRFAVSPSVSPQLQSLATKAAKAEAELDTKVKEARRSISALSGIPREKILLANADRGANAAWGTHFRVPTTQAKLLKAYATKGASGTASAGAGAGSAASAKKPPAAKRAKTESAQRRKSAGGKKKAGTDDEDDDNDDEEQDSGEESGSSSDDEEEEEEEEEEEASGPVSFVPVLELGIRSDGTHFTTAAVKRCSEAFDAATSAYAAAAKEAEEAIVAVACTHAAAVNTMAGLIAQLDVLLAFCEVAATSPTPWCKPCISQDPEETMEIKQLRHPLVEAAIVSSRGLVPVASSSSASSKAAFASLFIPNNVSFKRSMAGGSTGGARLAVISGPSMGGKSTYQRSIALAVILAQIGCYVPAESASLPLFSSIHSLSGASDDPMAGRSTFTAEIEDINSLLASATRTSLVLLDELGRSTSAAEGYGILGAVAEDLRDRVQCVTLISTHFHALSTLLTEGPKGSAAKNLHAEAFLSPTTGLRLLYDIREGASTKSLGVEIADYCGLPKEIVEDAILRARKEKRGQEREGMGTTTSGGTGGAGAGVGAAAAVSGLGLEA